MILYLTANDPTLLAARAGLRFAAQRFDRGSASIRAAMTADRG